MLLYSKHSGVTEDRTATTELATIAVAIDVEYIILISMFFLLLLSMIYDIPLALFVKKIL